MALRLDGLGREVVLTLVHDDGHVAALANAGMAPGVPAVMEEEVRQLHALFTFAGVTGWRVRDMAVAEAAAAFLGREACPRCAIVFPCGCSWLRVTGGQCTHGAAARVHRIGHLLGRCSNTGPHHGGPPLPTYTRVYLAGGRHAHLREDTTTARIMCDHGATGWYGDGSQREQEVAARLPLCPACVKAVIQ